MSGLDRALRVAGWGGAAVALLLPLMAMRVTDEVRWTASDFLVAAAMLGTAGLLAELALRVSRDWFYRLGFAAAIAAALMLVWAQGAVGVIGDGGSPANLLVFAAVAVAAVGAGVARLRAGGMAVAMAAAGAVTAVLLVAALLLDRAAAVPCAGITGVWALSAWLFSRAARRSAAAAAA